MSLGHVESYDWLISIPFHNFMVVAWQHGCVQIMGLCNESLKIVINGSEKRNQLSRERTFMKGTVKKPCLNMVKNSKRYAESI